MTTEITRRPDPPGQQLAALVQKMLPEIARALPKHINADRMARVALTAIRVNPKLAACSTASFLGSLLTAAQLGLEVNTPLGHAYLIPYKSDCQLIIGYQGMVELARRSGAITSLYAYAVHEGDEFRYTLGLDPTIEHVPGSAADRDRKPVSHVYAVARQKDGPPVFVVLTWSEVMAAKSRSRSSGGPWSTDPTAMALKTAVRRLWKWLPKSIEMHRAAALEAVDDTQGRVSQAAAWDPEVTAALEASGLEVETEAEVVAPPAPNAAAAFARKAGEQ